MIDFSVVAAEQGDDFAGADFKIDPVENVGFAVPGLQA